MREENITEEMDELEEWQEIDRNMNDKGILFQEKLDIYRNEY